MSKQLMKTNVSFYKEYQVLNIGDYFCVTDCNEKMYWEFENHEGIKQKFEEHGAQGVIEEMDNLGYFDYAGENQLVQKMIDRMLLSLGYETVKFVEESDDEYYFRVTHRDYGSPYEVRVTFDDDDGYDVHKETSEGYDDFEGGFSI